LSISVFERAILAEVLLLARLNVGEA
jgi:hypothetical protein